MQPPRPAAASTAVLLDQPPAGIGLVILLAFVADDTAALFGHRARGLLDDLGKIRRQLALVGGEALLFRRLHAVGKGALDRRTAAGERQRQNQCSRYRAPIFLHNVFHNASHTALVTISVVA